MLTYKHMEWNKDRVAEARRQGWGIFDISEDEPNLEIQKVDEEGMFDDDLQAILFVIEQASEGDELAKLAMRTVYYFSGESFPECEVCSFPFTFGEWDDRCTNPENGMGDIHTGCCSKCKKDADEDAANKDL